MPLTRIKSLGITDGTIAIADLSATGTKDATTFLRGDNTFATAGAAAGQVIQVVNATDSTERSTSSTSFVTASNTLSVSITPSATANKILILASSSGYTGGDNTAYYTLYRGATNLGSADGITMLKSTGGYGNIGFMVYDSPSTTSSTTYQVYMRGDGGANVRLNYGQGTATKGFITALEIKG